MKVSLNWLKEFTSIEISIDQLAEKIGRQLGAIESIENLGVKYRGIKIVKIVDSAPHPNSDHLQVCLIDDGGRTENVERLDKGFIPVVCGAPNARAGMFAVWIAPGASVPSTFGHEPIIVTTKDIRGQKSYGMLASAKELAIGDNHEGLMEISPSDGPPGTDFAAAFKLDDYIIDLENKMFTHRPDCFGQLGVAREIAGICGQNFHSPEWYLKPVLPTNGGDLKLTVSNDVPDKVPRFMSVALAGARVGQSPVWLQTYLSRLGVRPINNVVDVTNYLMLLSGQPLHAYDYDKLKSLSGQIEIALGVRRAKAGDKLKILGGKILVLDSDDLVIAVNHRPIGLAGVVGGAETEVDLDSQNLVIECASFDMYSIRHTAMRHGLFTDAVTRFTKGQSPLQNPAVLGQAVKLLADLTGADVASPVYDDNHLSPEVLNRDSLHPPVKLTADFLNSRLGLELTTDAVAETLRYVEFRVDTTSTGLSIDAPFWRTDIEYPEDVVEEVGRLSGYDRLPKELPQRTLKPGGSEPRLKLKSRVRDILSRAGASEILSYSFVHEDLMNKTGQDSSVAFRLANALSPQLQFYRLSLMPSLLERIYPNVKLGFRQFALFEIGQVHCQQKIESDTHLPLAEHRVGLVLTAAGNNDRAGAAYYLARVYLDYLARELGLDNLNFSLIKEAEPSEASGQAAASPLERNRAAYIKTAAGQIIGVIGEFKTAVRQSLKLPEYTAGFELDLGLLLDIPPAPVYRPLSRYPSISQDLSLKLPASVSFAELSDCLSSALVKLAPAQTQYDLSAMDIYQPADQPDIKHVTFRLTIASFARTFTDQAVNLLLDNLAQAVKDRYPAERL